MEYSELIAQALEARKRAYTPYSGFAVGAALEAENGQIFLGCNIESASYSPTNCAERTALFSAIAAGVTRFKKIAIVGGMQKETPQRICAPCGVCRQMLAEFCEENFEVVLGISPEEYEVHTLGELLPLSFSGRNLRP